MARWAKDNGWTYTKDDAELPRRWSGTLFDPGARTARDIYEKERDGVHLIVLTILFLDGSSTEVPLVGRELPAQFPVMTLQPPAVSDLGLAGSLLDRALQLHELDLAGSGWSVRVPDGGDEAAVRAALTPEVLRFLDGEAVAGLQSRIMFAGSHVFIDNRKFADDAPGDSIGSRLWVLDELCRLVRV